MDGGTGQAIPAVRVAPQLLSGSMFRDLADFVYLHDEARTRCPILSATVPQCCALALALRVALDASPRRAELSATY